MDAERFLAGAVLVCIGTAVNGVSNCERRSRIGAKAIVAHGLALMGIDADVVNKAFVVDILDATYRAVAARYPDPPAPPPPVGG